jgi:hypothetical protein
MSAALLLLLLLAVPELLLAAFVWVVWRKAKALAKTETVRQLVRAEIILGQAHDLLCDMVECSEREECLTVLDEGQEQWAAQILTNIQEHKNPELCRKKPLSKPR